MKICLFHPKRLPPLDYGGVERMVLWLAKGLKERGHDVWVAALQGSILPAGVKLLEMEPAGTQAEDLAKRLPTGIDCVHFMAPAEPGGFEKLPCPTILTVHGNGKPGESFPRNTVFLSADHAKRHQASVFVYNGIDPAEYAASVSANSRQGLLFLSKTSWRVKNLSGAMRLARRAQAPLKIAGGWRPWTSRVQARAWSIAQPQARQEWVGPVAGEAKAKLLGSAHALLFPVTWPEPFGLVVAEALMSGTPVLAPGRGSLPELIPADVGAIISTTVDANEQEAQWLHAIEEARSGKKWDPERCRAWAMERFHYLKMAEGYETNYRRVLAGELLHAKQPLAGDWRTE